MLRWPITFTRKVKLNVDTCGQGKEGQKLAKSRGLLLWMAPSIVVRKINGIIKVLKLSFLI